MEKRTTCKRCGVEIIYLKRKPLYCAEHKSNIVYKKPKQSSIPQKSKFEFKIQNWITILFPDRPYIFNGFYSWIKSPKGYPMQLDIFVYGSKPHFAIEINGKQHNEKQYFQTQEEFDYLQKCDKIKEHELFKRKIKLYSIPYTCNTFEQFKEIIINELNN